RKYPTPRSGRKGSGEFAAQPAHRHARRRAKACDPREITRLWDRAKGSCGDSAGRLRCRRGVLDRSQDGRLVDIDLLREGGARVAVEIQRRASGGEVSDPRVEGRQRQGSAHNVAGSERKEG